MKIIYDLTTYTEATRSLSELLDISKIDIIKYIRGKNSPPTAEEFLTDMNIKDSIPSHKDLHVASLHVTTNNDECEFIKKHGLVNLQQAVTMDTPLKTYLAEHGIQIDVQVGIINRHHETHQIDNVWRGYSYIEDETY